MYFCQVSNTVLILPSDFKTYIIYYLSSSLNFPSGNKIFLNIRNHPLKNWPLPPLNNFFTPEICGHWLRPNIIYNIDDVGVFFLPFRGSIKNKTGQSSSPGAIATAAFIPCLWKLPLMGTT